jgi:hypothetical protein
MTAGKPTMAVGWRVYGLGVIMLGMVCLAWGDFDPGQPVPKDLPGHTAHVPMLLADLSSHINWSENAPNLALIGAAWVVADSLARPRPSRMK